MTCSGNWLPSPPFSDQIFLSGSTSFEGPEIHEAPSTESTFETSHSIFRAPSAPTNLLFLEAVPE